MAQMCDCGSGLRRGRCCAWNPADRTRPTVLARLQPMLAEAHTALTGGDAARGETLLVDLLELAPDALPALALLADLRGQEGKSEAAERLLRRIITLDANNLPALLALGLALFGRGRLEQAEVLARNGLRVAPENPAAHNLMAMVLTEANRPQSGEYHYRRVLALSGTRDPILLANLAWNLKNQGRMAEARALYDESLAAAPRVRQTVIGFARLEEADRRFAAAEAVLDHGETAFPGDPQLRLIRATLLGRTGQRAAAVALLDRMDRARDEGLGATELLEKGRLLDRLGLHADAWAAFATGKERARQRSGLIYADAAAAAEIARLRGFFTESRLALLPRAERRAEMAQPIFILGFPRSGTTLLEQSLTAHSRIAAGDELPLIQELTQSLPRLLGSPLSYPEALSELWMGDQRLGLDLLRDVYLGRVRQMGIAGSRDCYITDKMPLNETHLGLIHLVFPESPLFHLIRHPLDVMVSAFSNLFTHGHCCGAELHTAALHYARTQDLVRHYRAEIPALRYRAIRYEAIVAEQETVLRGLFDLLGLDFEPGCLSFHENRRYARTASYAQVTEPLYDRSVGRWRQYRAELEPVLPILMPHIERLGYDLS